MIHESTRRIDRAIVGCLRGQDLSGYEIWYWLRSANLLDGLLDESELYPNLYRLEAEGLIESSWQEAERIRRRYRLTSTGLTIADEQNWPAQLLRSGDAIEHPARTHSPNPDARSWFVPPRDTEVALGLAPVSDREVIAMQRELDPAIAGYEARLLRELDLPMPGARRVSLEIGDHLTDSAHAIEQAGAERPVAVAEAIDRLGNADSLAIAAAEAQHTSERQSQAVGRAAFHILAEVTVWLAVSLAIVVAVPRIAGLLISGTALAGMHVAVLQTAEWSANQIAMMLCIGAFAAGRLSMGQLSRISGHSDAKLRRRWAASGGLAILAVALLLPGAHDWLVAATTLAAPLAFVAGTFRPKHQHETTYTLPGIGLAVLLMAAIAFLPGVRLFWYDPAATPGVPAASDMQTEQISITDSADGTFYYTCLPVSCLPGVGPVVVELWPVKANGVFLAVDPAAHGPAATSASDSSKVPVRDWWAVAVQTLPDGRRQALAVLIQPADNSYPETTLGWLLSLL